MGKTVFSETYSKKERLCFVCVVGVAHAKWVLCVCVQLSVGVSLGQRAALLFGRRGGGEGGLWWCSSV